MGFCSFFFNSWILNALDRESSKYTEIVASTVAAAADCDTTTGRLRMMSVVAITYTPPYYIPGPAAATCPTELLSIKSCVYAVSYQYCAILADKDGAGEVRRESRHTTRLTYTTY